MEPLKASLAANKTLPFRVASDELNQMAIRPPTLNVVSVLNQLLNVIYVNICALLIYLFE